MNVDIDRGIFPVRFLDLHLSEFCSWRMAEKPQRDFKLRWPSGCAGPATLRIGFEVKGKGTARPTIKLVPASEEDRATLHRYMAAIGRSDSEYIASRMRPQAEGAVK